MTTRFSLTRFCALLTRQEPAPEALMPNMDPTWIELVDDPIAIAEGTPVEFARTTAESSPLGYSTSIFGFRLNEPATLTGLKLKVQGSMSLENPQTPTEWYDVLASFPDPDEGELDVRGYTLNADAFAQSTQPFRIRLDEPWRWLRLLVGGTNTMGVLASARFRRF